MNDKNDNTKEVNSKTATNNINIIEEMKILEQEMKDPKNQTFKKTTYWNQLNKTEDNKNLETLLKEAVDCLMRIELKLNQMENIINK